MKTARLELRPAQMDDLAALHAMLSNPIMMRYWSSLPHETLERTCEWLEAMMTIPPDLGEDFVIVHEGTVIGKAGLHRFPDIGYALHPDYWGRGLAREALEPILDRAFDVHGLAYVEADVDPRNEASRRLLGRLGFTETRTARNTWLIGEEHCDSVYLRITAQAWRDRRSASD
ncbi:GNAT family N-acetyltransferase [Sphingomonas sp. MMS24-J13]|uniref:GNAT family N-acetyltransferase n=1 Tax=Sphingomonas sp. MMS24-J13 TaxID=3238686 RepID=UPI0038512F6A